MIEIDRRTLPHGKYRQVGFDTRQVFDIDISRVVTEYRTQILEDDSGNRFVASFPKNVAQAVQYGTCLVHLIRRAKEIKQEIELKKPRCRDQKSIRFCNRVVDLFKKACELGKRFNDLHSCRNNADVFETRLYRVLNTICSTPLAEHKAETLRKRLLDPKKEYDRLFTFLKYPDVQPTNNQAEQSLRNMVIFRKICFGTRSTHGSESHSVLPSLLLTARRQGKHPLAFFQTLFTSGTPTAQAALYDDSS